MSATIGVEGNLLLDDKPALTPVGNVLTHSSTVLMRNVCYEWSIQEKNIDFQSMPLTRLLISTLDCTEAEIIGLKKNIVNYAEGDTLRYHAPEDSALCKTQKDLWRPWLEWAVRHFPADWTVAHGIMPLSESAGVVDSVTAWLEQRSSENLIALYAASQMLGSFIMAAALVLDACSPMQAMECAWLERDHQMQTWGEEKELRHARDAALVEMEAIHRFIRLTRHPAPALR